MPKRSSVDDYFAQLEDVQRPRLEALRELSVEVDPRGTRGIQVEPSGLCPRREHEPMDASELQAPLLTSIFSGVLRGEKAVVDGSRL